MTSPPPAGHADLTRHRLRSGDGIGISVLVAAPPRGVPAADLPPVVAIHGFASSAAGGWGRTGHLDALTRAGRSVVAIDLRGHGESDKPYDDAAYGVDRVLGDIRMVADAIPDMAGCDANGVIDLIGYSLGSRLGSTVAAGGMLPVRRMVLGGFDGRPLFSGADPHRLERMAATAGNDPVALRHLVAGLSASGATAGGLTGGDDGVPRIPVLIVAGDLDPLATRAAEFASRLPDASYLEIPGRNHISTVPSKRYREGLVSFLAS